MDTIFANPEQFLKYGPIGFAALVFLAVVLSMSRKDVDERRSILRLIIWTSFGIYTIAATTLAFGDYTKVVSGTAQAANLQQGITDLRAAIERVQAIAPMVANSCPGGASGVSPANYGNVVAATNEALRLLQNANNQLVAANPG